MHFHFLEQQKYGTYLINFQIFIGVYLLRSLILLSKTLMEEKEVDLKVYPQYDL